MIIKADYLSEKQKKEVWQILVNADKEFIPPLSSRNDTTQKELILQNNSSAVPESYFLEMMNQCFILCIEEGEGDRDAGMDYEAGHVAGFLSYRRDHSLEIGGKEYISDYVSTIIVAPEARNKGYTQKMYEALFEAEPGKIFSTRTWSTNHAHIYILEKLGFELKLSIKDDRGEGIDTVYYVKASREQ